MDYRYRDYRGDKMNYNIHNSDLLTEQIITETVGKVTVKSTKQLYEQLGDCLSETLPKQLFWKLYNQLHAINNIIKENK
jgi:hypothetical protein